MKLRQLYKTLARQEWGLGFVKNGLVGVFSDDPMKIRWVKNPYKDRWFADPFILEVTEQSIELLVEEFCYNTEKGRIAKLTIDKSSMKIVDMKIILECPTHLSFPNILRIKGNIYVYPESCHSGKLDLYEYDKEKERLIFVKTICNDAIWDSSITDIFGEWLMFTANKGDHDLDIYEWNEHNDSFVYSMSIHSEQANSRMAGQFFRYDGSIFCPFQNCSKAYGGAVDIKKVERIDGQFRFAEVKKLASPHRTLRTGLHTLNEYKNEVVIDVHGYSHPFIGKCLHSIVRILKRK